MWNLFYQNNCFTFNQNIYQAATQECQECGNYKDRNRPLLYPENQWLIPCRYQVLSPTLAANNRVTFMIISWSF